MNQENKETQNLAPRSQKKPGFFKSLFAKRWTFPAIYLGAAALIIGLVVAQTQDAKPFNDAEKTPEGTAVTDSGNSSDTAPVTANQELAWPVAQQDEKEVQVTMSFYDETKDEKSQAKSIVKYDNNFYTQNGVVIGRKDDKPFTVVAAASGTVSRVENDPLMGQLVEIKHDNGYVTYYASLSDIKVKEGDKVVQGADIAKSGNNRIEADQKNHLHFEVKKDGKNVDPEKAIKR
ncbi:peptidoglycan DD-metalloendopeptidase family protein [Effusibacillus consociatus]|uniref:Peptidoglycan DD-metalloendopeptidase family protein n=1 Tax=Effusibacillus consociatus TaxID=1117041 RepID=A0ABV9Q6J9_9BACL